MKIEQARVDALVAYAFNNRKHDALQVDRIAQSIVEFGFNQPLVIDENNIVIVGHGRLEAAKKLKLETVPVVRLESLTEAQKKAYRILDNKLQNDSEWDLDNLRFELDALEELGFDVEPWDFKALFSAENVVVNELEELPILRNGEKNPFRQMTVTLHDEQFEEVESALNVAKQLGHGKSLINENSNGNALSFVCSFFNRKNDER